MSDDIVERLQKWRDGVVRAGGASAPYAIILAAAIDELARHRAAPVEAEREADAAWCERCARKIQKFLATVDPKTRRGTHGKMLRYRRIAAALRSAPPGGWRTGQPEPDKRPGRQFVRAIGWRSHSGAVWHRSWMDVACTDNEGPFGYRHEDIARICRDGDMDAVEQITHWMPAAFQPLPAAPTPPTAIIPDVDVRGSLGGTDGK